MIKKELDIFLNAVMFLTRIRVPKSINHNAELLHQTPRYFPLIGIIVGLVTVGVFLLTDFLLTPELAIMAAMIAGIFTTGAFHEDAFADVCDAFGGGWTKEKILVIMKDSRLGTYGVTGLALMLATKFLLLKEIASYTISGSEYGYINPEYLFFIGIFTGAHAASRFMPILLLQQYDYVSDPDSSKSKPMASRKPGMRSLAVAGITALLPFLLLGPLYLWILLPMALASVLIGRYFNRWIGGYTGDCLGSVQQVTEILYYLGVLVALKFLI